MKIHYFAGKAILYIDFSDRFFTRTTEFDTYNRFKKMLARGKVQEGLRTLDKLNV